MKTFSSKFSNNSQGTNSFEPNNFFDWSKLTNREVNHQEHRVYPDKFPRLPWLKTT